MFAKKILCSVLALSAIGLMVSDKAEAAFPEKPVNFIVPFGAGSGFDVIARKVAASMSKILNVPVPIKNVRGAGGRRGSIGLYKSKPDGYTIGFAHYVPFQTDIILKGKTPPIDYKKFAVVYQVSHSRHFIYVRKDLPVKTVADLKKLGRAIKFTGTGVGTITWVEGNALGDAVGFPVKFVTGYKNLTAAALAVAKGDADAGVGSAHHFRGVAGDVRPIVFLGTKRDNQYPNAETIVEAGYPKLSVLGSPRVVAAPPGTPADRVAVLRSAVKKVLADPAFIKWAQDTGYYLNPMGPAELAKSLQTNAEIYRGLKSAIKN